MSGSFSEQASDTHYSQFRGRLGLILLVLIFALPAIAAKIILTQNWYQSGVTNKGELIEPKLTYQMLSMNNTTQHNWHFGYVVPSLCNDICQTQIRLLLKSHTALGKYQSRVTPVLFVTKQSASVVDTAGFLTMEVDDEFVNRIPESTLLIVDPLGQFVMAFSEVPETELVAQSKNVLSDLRKLLKLSRVG